MYEIIFYHSRSGECEITDYLDELHAKADTDKNARINYKKILSYLYALSQYGTRIGKPVVKHIDGDIWELRPLSNRIFFFYWKDNNFVMLHHFIKKSKKTPKKEIEQAKMKLNDFLERSNDNEH